MVHDAVRGFNIRKTRTKQHTKIFEQPANRRVCVEGAEVEGRRGRRRIRLHDGADWKTGGRVKQALGGSIDQQLVSAEEVPAQDGELDSSEDELPREPPTAKGKAETAGTPRRKGRAGGGAKAETVRRPAGSGRKQANAGTGVDEEE